MSLDPQRAQSNAELVSHLLPVPNILGLLPFIVLKHQGLFSHGQSTDALVQTFESLCQIELFRSLPLAFVGIYKESADRHLIEGRILYCCTLTLLQDVLRHTQGIEAYVMNFELIKFVDDSVDGFVRQALGAGRAAPFKQLYQLAMELAILFPGAMTVRIQAGQEPVQIFARQIVRTGVIHRRHHLEAKFSEMLAPLLPLSLNDERRPVIR